MSKIYRFDRSGPVKRLVENVEPVAFKRNIGRKRWVGQIIFLFNFCPVRRSLSLAVDKFLIKNEAVLRARQNFIIAVLIKNFRDIVDKFVRFISFM